MDEQAASQKGDPSISVELSGSTTNVESAVDAELAEFERWVCRVLGSPMISVERAMVKTYLMWRVSPAVRD